MSRVHSFDAALGPLWEPLLLRFTSPPDASKMRLAIAAADGARSDSH